MLTHIGAFALGTVISAAATVWVLSADWREGSKWLREVKNLHNSAGTRLEEIKKMHIDADQLLDEAARLNNEARANLNNRS